MAVDYPFPAGPAPCRQDCSDCRFSGFDGDYGTLPTCDAPIELEDEEGLDADVVDTATTTWFRTGQHGACPYWRGANWCNTGAMEELELWVREREQQETP